MDIDDGGEAMNIESGTRCGANKRQAVSRIAVALGTIAAFGACDSQQQKPKVAADRAFSLTFDLVRPAAAQTADLVVPPSAISGAMQPVDEAFALFAASSGLAEVDGARLVLKTSKNAEVRGYAEKMVKDHLRSADELRKIVAPKGLALPPAPTGRHLDMVTKLSGVRPQDMDDAFLQRFGVDAHKEAISLYERHVIDGKDPQLKRYAEQTLPGLREHMSAAQKLLNASTAAR
jgi:putative membrane protein